MHRARFRRVLSLGARVPVKLGGTTLQVCGCAHQSASCQNPVLLGCSWRFHYIGMMGNWPHSSPILLSAEGEGGLRTPRFQSWGGLSGDHPPSGSPPRLLPYENQRLSYHPGIPRDLGILCLTSFLLSQEMTKVSRALCQESGQRPIYVIIIIIIIINYYYYSIHHANKSGFFAITEFSNCYIIVLIK